MKRSNCFCRSLLTAFFKEPLIHFTCALTVVIGGTGISIYYQHKSTENLYRISMKENDRKQAEATFNEVSSLMDDRLYKTRRLLSAYVQNDSAKIEFCRKLLSSQLEVWNANLGRMYVLIEEFYGVNFRVFFKNSIQKPFANIGNHIITEGAKTLQEQNTIRDTLTQVEANISKFDKNAT